MNESKHSGTLARILEDTRGEIAADKRAEPLEQLKSRIADAPKVVSFLEALRRPGCGMIAEIKECSPSKGAMKPENVRGAAAAYRNSKCVRAISVLTNRSHFGAGMTMEHLRGVKEKTGKPVLRKEFIIDAYQVYQARAYGADAILLMANILDSASMKEFHELAKSLGMEALFETHEPGELAKIPNGASIIGINSRNFCSGKETYDKSRELSRSKSSAEARRDLTTDFARFNYCDQLPAGVVRVAESGVAPENCRQVFDTGFSIILVGTSLLLGPEPVENALARFDLEIDKINRAKLSNRAS